MYWLGSARLWEPAVMTLVISYLSAISLLINRLFVLNFFNVIKLTQASFCEVLKGAIVSSQIYTIQPASG